MDNLHMLLNHDDPSLRRQGEELLRSLAPADAQDLLSRLKSWGRLSLDELSLPGIKTPQRLQDLFLRSTDLTGASLTNRRITGTLLHGSSLRRANMKGAVLHQVGACGVDLTGADLRRGDWAEVVLDGADLTDARAEGLCLHDASMVCAVLVRCQAAQLSAIGVDLRGADLRGADLTAAVLTRADLRWADLRGATLAGADLRFADLRGAALDAGALDSATTDNTLTDAPGPGCLCLVPGAMLRGSILAGQDLTGVRLSGADLRGADLRDADLSGADLSGADLRGALQDTRAPAVPYLHKAPAVNDLTGADLRGQTVDRSRVAESFAMGFWVDERTVGAAPELLRARGGVRVPAHIRPARSRTWQRWQVPSQPDDVTDTAAVPLVAGMWVWVEQGAGGWCLRAQTRPAASTLVVTNPPLLSRRRACLQHPETYETSLLWLALTLGAPQTPPATISLRLTRRGWQLSSDFGSDYWNAVLPLALPQETAPATVLAHAWSWWAGSEKTARGEEGAIMSNPWPPRFRTPVLPSDFMKVHTQNRHTRLKQASWRRQSAVIALWKEQHAGQ